jgi:hypothetical protein
MGCCVSCCDAICGENIERSCKCCGCTWCHYSHKTIKTETLRITNIPRSEDKLKKE